jgi:hypothetical protein
MTHIRTRYKIWCPHNMPTFTTLHNDQEYACTSEGSKWGVLGMCSIGISNDQAIASARIYSSYYMAQTINPLLSSINGVSAHW